jgi:hypothetical protein
MASDGSRDVLGPSASVIALSSAVVSDRHGQPAAREAQAATHPSVVQTDSRGWTTSPVFYPEIIDAVGDSPVLLEKLLNSEGDDRGLQIVKINGTEINPSESTPLPGIRVGSGEGTGFIFRRALDGQLIFSPDDGYSGLTMITCTVADASGDEASFVATVNVRPTSDSPVEIAFVDGSNRTSVTSGLNASILGALTVIGIDVGEAPILQVYENGADDPSPRFVVTGDRLQLMSPLDHSTDGTVLLRIAASDGLRELGSSEFEIDVRPTGIMTPAHDITDQFVFDADLDTFVMPFPANDVEMLSFVDEAYEPAALSDAPTLQMFSFDDQIIVDQLPAGRGEPFGE